ncbi:hypothetical protein LTR84_009575 [Exophiala bonariae]|uniref:Zn(2)-C6 fungal-type domain-containing protein n=1 Tax=Exophiala bonariae TaxID=1690606 RepID=A0AAV9NIN5_9EURO|nr:hypothetical protein LTR84_009575 [Exophiala bonariae]
MASDLFCEICNTFFQRQEHYQRHLRTHTKEKPFTCSECNQAFGRVDSLFRHHTTVHGGNAVADPSKRQNERRRVAQACKSCGATKVRCDGERPCQRCVRQNLDCYYGTSSKRKQSTSNNGSHDAASSNSNNNNNDIDNHSASSKTQIPSQILKRARSNDGQTTPAVSVSSMQSMQVDNLQQPPTTAVELSSYDPSVQQHLSVSNENLLFTTATLPVVESNSRPPDPDVSSSGGPVPMDLNHWDGTIPLPNLGFDDSLSVDDWLNFDVNTNALLPLLPQDSAFEAYSNVWLASFESKSLPPLFAEPMEPSPIARFYSRAHSPEMDQDSVGPREYRPTSIEVDAPLVFPNMEDLPMSEIDAENLAHVEEITPEIVNSITGYTNKLERNGPYPPFLEMRIPQRPVLNSWVQLYFEHFHPIFPMLHKPSFQSTNTHWLLFFAVAAIGAHYSNLKGAQQCARAMHELVRRQAASLCEQYNHYGRALFMIQTNLLNHIGFIYSGERRALEIAEFLQALPPTLARRKGLFTNRLSYQKIMELDLTLSQKWQVWALDEERRRTGFAVWLLDSQFDHSFDLTRLMKVEELQMSLPQSEERWGASSAQSWASCSLGTAQIQDCGLEEVIRNDSWRPTWKSTGSIGKQVLLQQLIDVMNSQSGHPGAPSFSQPQKHKAEETLLGLLTITEDEDSNEHFSELKASIAHRLMIATALTIRKSPTRKIAAVALKTIYGRMEDPAWNALASQWKNAADQARLSVYWAARSLHIVRSSRCTHFATPDSLLKAVLVLWLYALLSERFEDRFKVPTGPAVILGSKSLQDMDSLDWISAGWSGVKLPGIGNLLCPEGRYRLLDESIGLMRSLKSWAISASYSQLLVRLRATERSAPASRMNDISAPP